MRKIYFESIQLTSVQCSLMSDVQTLGAIQGANVKVTALQVRLTADVRRRIHQASSVCEDGSLTWKLL